MRKDRYIHCGIVVMAVVLSIVGIKLMWDSRKAEEQNAKQEPVFEVQQELEQSPEELPETEPIPEQNPPETKEYYQAMKTAMEGVSGECQWGYQIFSSGELYMTEAKAVPSASVIKVFIMEYAFEQITKGELALTDTLSGNTVQNLLHAMITRSDNDATNVLIDAFVMETMNQFFLEKGYQHTKVQRKMLDTKAQKEGLDNFTSVVDVMNFLDRMYRNRETEPYRSMLDIMKKQEIKTKIPRKFPAGIVIANKTGELSNVENDIGILFGEQGDYAVVFLCSNLSDTVSARNAISDGAYNFYLAVEG